VHQRLGVLSEVSQTNHTTLLRLNFCASPRSTLPTRYICA
jgi:hypothetical protein